MDPKWKRFKLEHVPTRLTIGGMSGKRQARKLLRPRQARFYSRYEVRVVAVAERGVYARPKVENVHAAIGLFARHIDRSDDVAAASPSYS